MRLEAKICFEILGDLADKTLERQLPDEQFGRLLVSTNLTEGNSSWPEAMGLLDTTGGWCRLARSLGSKLLAGGLTQTPSET
mmetsp:Transcript_9110/g.30380  ORF Transcript_9110/g.30380 Transcript_9110/m.30380 type:complete len:82 (+) Transcript_9110:291-536(+)